MWIVSELFYPDETSTGYILTTIASALADSEDVNVICGPAAYQKSKLTSTLSLDDRITVDRVRLWELDKNKSASRILRLVLLGIMLSWRLIVKAHRGDKVLMVTNPAPLVVILPIICKLKKLKLVILVHDVFPENLPVAGLINKEHFIFLLLKRMFNRAYSKADYLIVLGRDMQQMMGDKIARYKKKTQIKVIENWADNEFVYPLPKAKEEIIESRFKRITFQFAGNLGRVQGLMQLLEAIRLANNERLFFEFIGEGALKSEIQQYIQKFSLSNVSLHPSFNRTEQNNVLNACDVGIVCLAEGMKGLGVPSKTYNILSAGKPVLYVGAGESEISLLVTEEKVGWAFSGFGEELITFFAEFDDNRLFQLQEMGENARKVAVGRFSKEHILNEYKLLINSI